MISNREKYGILNVGEPDLNKDFIGKKEYKSGY
jgi:hypothetical protein